MYCASCGGKNDDSVKFCAHCGAPVSPAADPAFQHYAHQGGCGANAKAPYVSDYLAGNIILSILCACTFLPFFAWIGLGFSIASRSAKRAGAYDVAHSRAGVARSLFWVQFVVGIVAAVAAGVLFFCAFIAELQKNPPYPRNSDQLTAEQREELGEAFGEVFEETGNLLEDAVDEAEDFVGETVVDTTDALNESVEDVVEEPAVDEPAADVPETDAE